MTGPVNLAQKALEAARAALASGTATDEQLSGIAMVKLINLEREVAFAKGWSARQRLREANVIPTKADYEEQLAKAKEGAALTALSPSKKHSSSSSSSAA